MANDFNAFTCTGRLGADPEVRFLSDGKQVVNFNVACGESWRDKDGSKKEKTEWFRIVIFGKLAEISAEYLSKGKQVLISGKFQTRSWDDKDGNKRQTTEVVASQMIMLSGGEKKEGTTSNNEPTHNDEDVPF